MNVLARAGVCWLVLACFSMTANVCCIVLFNLTLESLVILRRRLNHMEESDIY